MNINLIAYRLNGTDKMVKPKEMKGSVKIISAPMRGKRKSYVYQKGDVFYLHLTDLFSREASFPEQEDASIPTSALAKKYPNRFAKKRSFKSFDYPDSWCTIIEPNEGIIKIEGLIDALDGDNYPLFWKPFLPKIVAEITDTILNFKENNGSMNGLDQYSADLDRFINDMVVKIKKDNY